MPDRSSGKPKPGYDDLHIKTRPKPAELGYLAGIMDGEGSFVTKTNTNNFGLRVAMTDGCVIDWLHVHFAGFVTKAGKTVTGNQMWVWALHRQTDLAYLLPLLSPHIVCKKAQVEAMRKLVKHLQAVPRWEIPTYSVPAAERDRRRKVKRKWRNKADVLRMAVRDARPEPHVAALYTTQDNRLKRHTD